LKAQEHLGASFEIVSSGAEFGSTAAQGVARDQVGDAPNQTAGFASPGNDHKSRARNAAGGTRRGVQGAFEVVVRGELQARHATSADAPEAHQAGDHTADADCQEDMDEDAGPQQKFRKRRYSNFSKAELYAFRGCIQSKDFAKFAKLKRQPRAAGQAGAPGKHEESPVGASRENAPVIQVIASSADKPR